MNTQKPLPVVQSDDESYSVHSVFKTIQGEGPFAGVPAIFVRLAGCNLQCPECDTAYTAVSDHQETTAELVNWILETIGESKVQLVVITGGEPFRQDLAPLVYALVREDLSVQIETNGTLFQQSFPYTLVTVVCSPKVEKVHASLIPHVTSWKYVVGPGDLDERGLPLQVLGSSRSVFRDIPEDAQVYLQPLDTGRQDVNAVYTLKTSNACIQYGHRLCVQVHKMVGLD